MADSDHEKRIPDAQKPRETAEAARMDDKEVREIHAQLMREKEEPTESFRPVPMFLIFLFAGLMGWAGYYMGEYSGGFSDEVYNEHARSFGGAGATVEKKELDPFAKGQRIFTQQCVACHQSDAQGVPGQFPPLVDSRWVQGKEERVIKILMHGMEGPVEVKGNIYDGNMPDLNLSDSSIAAVLTYVRQSFGNEAAPISVEKVTEVRSNFETRRQPWTADELLELHPWSQDTEEESSTTEEATEESAPELEAPAEPASA